MSSTFHRRVLNWFDKNGRHDLPWQKKSTPYRVWVSEIMLQQTQVNTVKPYYRRFMKRFPSVKQLALADQDEVLAYWSGLGYYARARNLHKSAQIIHHQYRGRLPDTVEDLMSLPGIGRSTAGAIVSLAHEAFAVILDGNVNRVLARHAAVAGWPGNKKVHDHLWALAETRTPAKKNKAYTQAMMDIGSLICTRSKPKCHHCPVQSDCMAFSRQEQHLYPGKKPPKSRRTEQTYLLIIENQYHEILLEKRQENGIWGGLWSFPEAAQVNEGIVYWESLLRTPLSYNENLPQIEHSFSHYDLLIQPTLLCCQSKKLPSSLYRPLHWHRPGQALPGGIPAPIQKLLKTKQWR